MSWKTLPQLLEEYNTDKGTYHTYGPAYEYLFDPVRFNVRNVLEIGVFEGESLRVWEEYFPYALIWGFDKDLSRFKGKQFGISDTIFEHNSTSRILLVSGDQSKEEELLHLFENCTKHFPLDIIIDDGSHDSYDQLLTMVTWIQYWMKNIDRIGGDFIYVIEDVPRDRIERMAAALGTTLYLGDQGIFDDNMLILSTRENRVQPPISLS